MKYLFFIWVLFHKYSRITGLHGKGKGISLTPHYHFHPLHKHLDISRAITAESSPPYIAGSPTRNGNLWFLSASREPLSYAPSKLCALCSKAMRLVLKVNNKDKRRQWHRSGVFIVNFEHISHLQLPERLTGSNTSLCIVFEHL